MDRVYDYTVIGAGPAGIIAVVKILETLFNTTPEVVAANRLAKKIVWVDPQFNIGAFGEQWRNVPGNTTASKYRAVYEDMFAVLNAYGIHSPELTSFSLYSEHSEYPSLLKVAAEPLRWMTQALESLVTPLAGHATEILRRAGGLEIHMAEGPSFFSKRCILAIGAKAKPLSLRDEDSRKIIPLEMALDYDLLRTFVFNHPAILKSSVLVQGSSHSAALAVWNLLACGTKVKQIMNKPYLYYSTYKNDQGISCSINENTGLKGQVAQFTRDLEVGTIYPNQWSYDIIANDQAVDYSHYSHVVLAIGLEAVDSLSIHGVSSSRIHYDYQTTRTEVPGVFVVGVGYPPQASDGSKNVGISKFWPDMGRVVSYWQESGV